MSQLGPGGFAELQEPVRCLQQGACVNCHCICRSRQAASVTTDAQELVPLYSDRRAIASAVCNSVLAGSPVLKVSKYIPGQALASQTCKSNTSMRLCFCKQYSHLQEDSEGSDIGGLCFCPTEQSAILHGWLCNGSSSAWRPTVCIPLQASAQDRGM